MRTTTQHAIIATAATIATLVLAAMAGGAQTGTRSDGAPLAADTAHARTVSVGTPSCDYPGYAATGIDEDAWQPPLHCERPFQPTHAVPGWLATPDTAPMPLVVPDAPRDAAHTYWA